MRTQRNGAGRRAHGSGGLLVKGGAYFGKWRVDGRQVMRRLGPVRLPGTNEGLTKTQAEARLRSAMADMTAPPATERLTVQEAAQRLLDHLEAMGRKPSTLRAYRSKLKAQIKPRIGTKPMARVRRIDVESFRDGCLRDGLSPKYVANALGFLHGIFEFGVRHGWAASNPCHHVDAPRALEVDTAIRFLEPAEVEALLRSVTDSSYGRVQRALYLAAVMTGMRQGELLALRWQDVDWSAQRIRVSRNYVNGTFGTPKSHRGRSVPMADRLGGELDRLYRASAYQADTDLVFGNPQTGTPMNGHTLTRTFQSALKTAEVRKIRFHDLRHTFGTTMAASGHVSLRALQEWMGHESIRTTQIYAHYMPREHEADLINAAFGEPSGIGVSSANDAPAQDLGATAVPSTLA
jgi:integrase